MNPHPNPDAGQDCFELRFASLFQHGRGSSFPCDAAGLVDLDALSERTRIDYFFARGLVGRDFARPAVVARTPVRR